MVASAWVRKKPRQRKSGKLYNVRYRIGGRERTLQLGGSFETQREAKRRRDAIAGELASLRVPALSLLDRPNAAPDASDGHRALEGKPRRCQRRNARPASGC